MGSAIIDRKDKLQALDEINKLASKSLDKKWAICLFPEGTRARDGVLKKFKTAGFTSLLQQLPGAQVVPAVIDGSWELLRYNFMPLPYGTDVTFKVFEPIDSTNKDPKEILENIETSIRNYLNQTIH